MRTLVERAAETQTASASTGIAIAEAPVELDVELDGYVLPSNGDNVAAAGTSATFLANTALLNSRLPLLRPQSRSSSSPGSSLRARSGTFAAASAAFGLGGSKRGRLPTATTSLPRRTRTRKRPLPLSAGTTCPRCRFAVLARRRAPGSRPRVAEKAPRAKAGTTPRRSRAGARTRSRLAHRCCSGERGRGRTASLLRTARRRPALFRRGRLPLSPAATRSASHTRSRLVPSPAIRSSHHVLGWPT